MEPKHLSLDEVFDLSLRVLQRAGASKAHAEAVAKVVTAAEADECASHGVYRLIGYASALRSGAADGTSTPKVSEPSPALVQVDAMRGFAPLAVKLGRPRLIAKAKEGGIAALAITRCYHIAALWVDVEPLAEAGLVALACTPGQRRVAPHGGKRPLLGTNPIAFAWPRESSPPFVFDLATSAVARGEIELRARSGEELPPGWAIDKSGNPTTDAPEALAGALLPFGGYKGSALAIMVELLAGVLLGEVPEFEAVHGTGPRLGGELIIALAPEFFGNPSAGGAESLAEPLFAELQQAANGRLPSTRRYLARERTRREGVTIPGALYQELRALLK